MPAILARIVKADGIGTRRLSTTENAQREDLTVFETIEATVAMGDGELYGDEEYVSMGPVRLSA